MNKRKAGALILTGLGSVAAMAQDRPNIVLMLADDWGFPHASAYGDPEVDSRVLEWMASEGMLFTHAYSASPHSSPSRACLLTGQYAHRLRDACSLNCYFPRDLHVYTQDLEAAGYETVFWHKGWGPGVWNATGWEHNPAGWEVTNLVKYIEEDADPNKPFCVWMGSRRPHRPYAVGSGEAHGFNKDAIAVSPDMPDAPDVRTDLADYYYNIQLFQDECEEVIEALRKSGRLDNTLLIITGDNGDSFPRAKSNLYDMGCHVPMAVRWPGVIEPGSVCDGFVSLMDLCATFYEAAGVKAPSNLDSQSLIPVFKGKSNGRDIMFFDRERHTNSRPGGYGYPMRSVRTKDFLYIRNFHPERYPAGVDPVFGDTGNGPAKAYMSFHRDEYPKEIFERAFGLRPAEELYDLRNDPYCHNNVAEDASYKRIRRQMARKLARWMKQTDDPRVDPDDMSFDTYPYVRKAMKLAVFDMQGTVTGPNGEMYSWVVEQMDKLRKEGIEVLEFQAPESYSEWYDSLGKVLADSGLAGREIALFTDNEEGILAAKKLSIIPAGVTWGALNAQQMLMAGASYVLSDQEDLERCVDFL